MTKTEQNALDQIFAVVSEMRKVNQALTDKVLKLQSAVEKKMEPVNMQDQILAASIGAVQASIQKVLTDYNSPLHILTKGVIESNSGELRRIISDAFSQVIRTEDFKRSIVDAFAHKVARTVISNNDGLFDKVSNELKSDAVFKAKMIAATASVVNECLAQKAIDKV